MIDGNENKEMVDGTDNENELASQIQKLDESLEAVHETLKVEGKKRDKRIRTNRIAIAITVLVAVVGILVGALGIHATNESNTERDQARVASCMQYNKQQKAQIEAELVESHDIVQALTEGSPDPTITEKAALYNQEHDKLIRSSHPDRDCSPEGIAKYLSNPNGG